MSTDYSAACMTCEKHIHIGQQMAGRWSFGWGTGDIEGARAQGEWLMEHVHHDVRVLIDDSVPEHFEREELKGEQ